MTWFKSLGIGEIFLIGLFVLFYASYLIRVIRVGRVLQSDYKTVFVKLILRSTYFALLIIALLGPSFGETSKEVQSVGKDIYLCIDLSKSMNAFDIQPTRLERVKFELKNIIQEFHSDRIGLIIFSSEAFVQCPLTYDQGALRLFIDGLHTRLVPNTGTNIGPPLRMALNKLNSEESLSTQQKSKIIILLSDGEDFGDEASNLSQEIEQNGITLFTMGVGTRQGSKIVTDRGGFKKDREGNDVVSQLEPKTLKSLALRTGGKYFEINQNRNDTDRLINTINGIEGELRESRQLNASDNKYYYFLALGLLLMSLDMVINLRPIRI